MTLYRSDCPPLLRLALALAATTAFAFSGCSKKAEAGRTAAAPAVPVSLQAVRVEGVQRQIEVVGTLFGDEDTMISAKVPGKIVSLTKDMGDQIDSGETLAQVETTDYELAVSQRRLAVRESLAKIGLSELPPADFDPESVPTIQRAKLQSQNAEAKFARGKTLFEQTPPRISAQEFDDLKTALDVAGRDAAVEILTAKSVVEEAKARQGDLQVAIQRLKDATVTAPPAANDRAKRTYAIAARMVSVGEYVKEGDRLFRLVDDHLVKLRADVPERYAGRIKIGQDVKVIVESSPKPAEGKVSRINSQIDPANRTFEVEVEVPNPRRELKPGAFARALIQTHVDPSVVFVPQEAILSFAGVNKVFVVEDGKAREIRVELGDRQGDWVEIVNGLTGKESVVVAGTSKLATGVGVDIKPLPAPTTKPAEEDAEAEASGVAGEAQS